MLEVNININRKVDIVTLHAVRTKPKSKTVKDGVICTYDVVYNNTTVGSIKGAYGCGIDLAIRLLEEWKKNSANYKLISIYKKIKEQK